MNWQTQHLSVLRFRLEKDLGYGYCKLVDLTHIDPWYGMVVKVFDYKSDQPIETVETIRNADYLLSPISLGWHPNLGGPSDWQIIGSLSNADDEQCPVFKTAAKVNFQDNRTIVKKQRWHPVFNFKERGAVCEFKQVAHLETLALATPQNIINRTSMTFLRKAGIPIEDYYYLEGNAIAREDYYHSSQMPLYGQVPKKYRNKTIPPRELPKINYFPYAISCIADVLSSSLN